MRVCVDKSILRIVISLSKNNLIVLGLLNLEGKLYVSESHVLRGNETSQEDIDTLPDRTWHGDHTVSTWHSIEAADEVREIIENG